MECGAVRQWQWWCVWWAWWVAIECNGSDDNVVEVIEHLVALLHDA